MAHPDLDQLLSAAIPFAKEQLGKRGSFLPFGATMSTDGKVACNAAYEGEPTTVGSLMGLLTEAFRREASAGSIRAAALCLDARTIPPGQTEKTDAICVRVEHENGEAADVFLPYKKGWFGKIRYGELFGAARQREFFS
jgi:hypothetical protein